jgi:uncharacterized protein (TIGR00730 family)
MDPRRSPRRRTLPEPPEPRHETVLQRWRRKVRRKTLRLADWSINLLYRAISRIAKAAPKEKRYYRVAIFGSSRIRRDDEIYAQVRELARRLSYIGCDIVTGGGPGLMTAANEGAREGAYHWKTRSFGLTILLPIEEQPNPFLDEVAEHKTFFSRLHQFIRLSHAYIVVDGGIGTSLEALMVWQLVQVRLLDSRPLIFVGPMWRGLRDWVEADLIRRGLASPGDTDLPYWVNSMDEAVEIVEEDRNRFLERNEVILPPPVEFGNGDGNGEELPEPAWDESVREAAANGTAREIEGESESGDAESAATDRRVRSEPEDKPQRKEPAGVEA